MIYLLTSSKILEVLDDRDILFCSKSDYPPSI